MKKVKCFLVVLVMFCLWIACFPYSAAAQASSECCIAGKYVFKTYRGEQLFDQAEMKIEQANCGTRVTAESKGGSDVNLQWKGSIARKKNQANCCMLVLTYQYGEDGGALNGAFCEKGERLQGLGNWSRKLDGKMMKQGRWTAYPIQVSQKQPQKTEVKDQKKTSEKQDDRFVANKNGTVLDTKTNLMWAAKDNGKDIDWEGAKSYCKNFRGGGYKDWRLPTQEELASLYDGHEARPGACDKNCSSRPGGCKETYFNIHVATQLIDISCYWIWTSEIRGSDAASFGFDVGKQRYWHPQSHTSHYYRVLPVRSSKEESLKKQDTGKTEYGRFVCKSFDALKLEATGMYPLFVGEPGKEIIMTFPDDESFKEDAKTFVEMTRKYNLNQYCRMERDGDYFIYFLSSGKAPAGPFPKEECTKFKQSDIKITEGSNKKYDVLIGGDKVAAGFSAEEATAIYNAIKKYEFTYFCNVNAAIGYLWRK